MTRTLSVTFSLLLAVGAFLWLVSWEPWKSRERERELAWLVGYAAWSDRIDAGLSGGDYLPGANCERAYRNEVGDPPSRLVPAARIALDGCRRLRFSIAGSELGDGSVNWYDVRGLVLTDLTDRRMRVSRPERSPELAARATPLAGRHPEVLCWSSIDWEQLSEEWSLVQVNELYPIGFADQAGGRIHLAPQICEPLRRFFGTDYAPNLNTESFDLAVALVTLAHEAEHLRSPRASEAEVECVAIQRVRDLVRADGRPRSYENLMAGLAWDVGYPDMPPAYRTGQCHDGSALDVRPETSVWP
ncbi:MAG: hypothetical protein QOF45_1692 [Gaiellaceae bacterium]|nr:hypothetical protein [Gaiellaceae bacterium]